MLNRNWESEANSPRFRGQRLYNTQIAIATLKEMVAAGDKPFFLGMGYKLPHLNRCAPKKYWDLYDPVKIPMATEDQAPKNGAAMGLHASFELRTRAGIPKYRPLGPKLSRMLPCGPGVVTQKAVEEVHCSVAVGKSAFDRTRPVFRFGFRLILTSSLFNGCNARQRSHLAALRFSR